MGKHKIKQKKNQENYVLWTTKLGANNPACCDLKLFPFVASTSAKFNKNSPLIPRFVFPLKMNLECKAVAEYI